MMTLISLLLALVIERVTAQTEGWRAQYHLQRYFAWVRQQGWLTPSAEVWKIFVIGFVPALATALLMDVLDSSLLSLLANTVILLLCFGCPHLRAAYRGFLQASNRGDLVACELYAQKLGHSPNENGASDTFGQQLVWLNYTHYAAVLVFFTFFGAAGAVFYVSFASLIQFIQTQEQAHTKDNTQVEAASDWMKAAGTFQYWIDWLPVRIASLGFLLVGHFARAFSVWAGLLLDFSVSAKTLLCQVSKAAEDTEAVPIAEGADIYSCCEEPKVLVKLAKRNMLLMVMVVSVLTLAGWL
ncbi:beta-lactamase regulator AmpE [Alteromonas flava]|uniref:beta-lactamase regulator AmpE n=1 Tax=Alteromonas flava TaxID=2048003 RepID=UPI000C287D61|nr:beta-lactamase regulator AmpE [Alteromonas flava]